MLANENMNANGIKLPMKDSQCMARFQKTTIAACLVLVVAFAVVVGYCAMQVRGIAWVFGLLWRLLERSAHC